MITFKNLLIYNLQQQGYSSFARPRLRGDVQTSFSKPDPSLDQNVRFPKLIFMPSLYFFQIWPILKFGEVHSKDQLQWHSLVFSLSLLFIWSKKNNYVDTLWSFGKAQSLGLGYVPSTTTRKPPLSKSDFSAPIGEKSSICCLTLILKGFKGLFISMILHREFGLNLEWSSNGNCFQRHLKLI